MTNKTFKYWELMGGWVNGAWNAPYVEPLTLICIGYKWELNVELSAG